MRELEEALTGEAAHVAPGRILEGLDQGMVHREVVGAPHTIYQEVWHICFWLQMSLDWIGGIETPYPVRPEDAFSNAARIKAESWERLCQRLFRGLVEAAVIAGQRERFDVAVKCPSRPGVATQTMTVGEQLVSLAAHDSYHFGRIVVLRQMLGAWPPKSGGFSW